MPRITDVTCVLLPHYKNFSHQKGVKKPMNQRKIVRYVAVMVMLAVMLAVPMMAGYPKHENFISDPNGVLSADTVAAIEAASDSLFKTKEVRIAVCLTDSTGNETITDFSRNLFSEWEMCDGVLLVLDTATPTYFAVQSVDVDDIVTNTVLADILAANMEEEFAAGNTDRGVMKTITALSQFMSANLPDLVSADAPAAEAETNETAAEEEEPSGFVKFMKAILWLIVIVVVLGAGVFVVGLFNDEVGDILRTYVFRRSTPQPPVRNDYYDDRLYGNANSAPRRNPQNPYNPAGYNGQYNRPQNGQYRNQAPRNPAYDPYNDYEMQYRQTGSQGRPQGQPRPQNGQYRQNPGQYPQQSGQYRQNPGQRPPQPRQNPNYRQNPNNRNY